MIQRQQQQQQHLIILPSLFRAGCFWRPVQWEVRSGPQAHDRKLPGSGERRGSVSELLHHPVDCLY